MDPLPPQIKWTPLFPPLKWKGFVPARWLFDARIFWDIATNDAIKKNQLPTGCRSGEWSRTRSGHSLSRWQALKSNLHGLRIPQSWCYKFDQHRKPTTPTFQILASYMTASWTQTTIFGEMHYKRLIFAFVSTSIGIRQVSQTRYQKNINSWEETWNILLMQTLPKFWEITWEEIRM